jgi:hypothetical protein
MTAAKDGATKELYRYPAQSSIADQGAFASSLCPDFGRPRPLCWHATPPMPGFDSIHAFSAPDGNTVPR